MGLLNWLKGGSPKKDDTPPISEVFGRVYTLMTDDEAQNRYLPPVVLAALKTQADRSPHGHGPFGRSPNNPIPVNGPLGEILYLSQLRSPNGQPYLSHRVGSENSFDQYELISLDGHHTDTLYFDMYYPRKSCLCPENMTRRADMKDFPFIFSVNKRVDPFPQGMLDALVDSPPTKLLMPVKPSLIEDALKALEAMRGTGRGASATGQLPPPVSRPHIAPGGRLRNPVAPPVQPVAPPGGWIVGLTGQHQTVQLTVEQHSGYRFKLSLLKGAPHTLTAFMAIIPPPDALNCDRKKAISAVSKVSLFVGEDEQPVYALRLDTADHLVTMIGWVKEADFRTSVKSAKFIRLTLWAPEPHLGQLGGGTLVLPVLDLSECLDQL